MFTSGSQDARILLFYGNIVLPKRAVTDSASLREFLQQQAELDSTF